MVSFVNNIDLLFFYLVINLLIECCFEILFKKNEENLIFINWFVL